MKLIMKIGCRYRQFNFMLSRLSLSYLRQYVYISLEFEWIKEAYKLIEICVFSGNFNWGWLLWQGSLSAWSKIVHPEGLRSSCSADCQGKFWFWNKIQPDFVLIFSGYWCWARVIVTNEQTYSSIVKLYSRSPKVKNLRPAMKNIFKIWPASKKVWPPLLYSNKYAFTLAWV